MVQPASSPARNLPPAPKGKEVLDKEPLHVEVRILLLAPYGRDERRITEALSHSEITPVICKDTDVLLEHLQEGAAAAIIAQEALSAVALAKFAEWLALQPPWSDVPFIVVTCGGIPNPATVRNSHELERLGNVTLLDRPLRPDTVRSCLRVAMRARQRQYGARRHQENLSVAIRDLEQFAYSASHDLREPLRTVAIYSELVASRYAPALDEQGLTFLGYIQSAAGRMEMLVRDLLAYTQAAGPDEGAPVAVSAADQLMVALGNLRAAIDRTRSIITFGALPPVQAKPFHLQQLFQHLVANAIKYRRTNKESQHMERARIHIAAVHEDTQWTFAVSDNGIGIEPRFQQQIFGIFKRLHTNDSYDNRDPAKDMGAGTGIGLAICQKIVERYGGRIWVESELGQGSTFFFTIPGLLTVPDF
jgi:signal transduction histidine kinase